MPIKSQLEVTTQILRSLPKDLTSSEQILLLTISSYINPERDGCARCWPSNEQLVKLTGMSEKTVKRSLIRLEGLGFIERQTKYDGASNKRTRLLILNVDRVLQSQKTAAEELIPAQEDAWGSDDEWGDPVW
ncbi:helix-turn-helix domain-containing protein [Aeromonas rivipollensis]|uniref:helix-turn-helix domain-containing protein n=1 Tax=Aeromonas rivipollensis TaxID=948519 RepID=UPI0038D05E83